MLLILIISHQNCLLRNGLKLPTLLTGILAYLIPATD